MVEHLNFGDPAPTRVMGILNVTPDSFSDGGQYTDLDRAVAHGIAMAEAGAAIVDVGGESTRPGAGRVDAAAEAARVLDVVAALAAAGVNVSIDTYRAETARAAVAAGAVLVNDVSGGLNDPDMFATVARLGVPYILQHWRGTPATMDSLAVYDDVVADVCHHLRERLAAARAAGVADIILDPGLGFAKNPHHNWTILAHLERFTQLGCPLLIGASRKRFIGAAIGADAPDAQRDVGTAVITAVAARAGVWGVRVHDVAASVTACRVAAAIADGGGQG